MRPGAIGLGAFFGAAIHHARWTDWLFSPLAALYFVLIAAHDFVYAAQMLEAKKQAAAAKHSMAGRLQSLRSTLRNSLSRGTFSRSVSRLASEKPGGASVRLAGRASERLGAGMEIESG